MVVRLVRRWQGLILSRDNPKGIQGLGDLMRDDVVYVNRQRGAGTRVLFDFQLSQLGISLSASKLFTKGDEFFEFCIS